MSSAEKYVHQGHPSVEELMSEQGVVFPRDPRDLLGDFWPDGEPIDEFLAVLREGLGHARSDPAV